jgi:hypothetical protein
MNVTETFLAEIRVSMDWGVNSPPKFCSTTQRQDVLPADTSLRSRQGDWAEH